MTSLFRPTWAVALALAALAPPSHAALRIHPAAGATSEEAGATVEVLAAADAVIPPTWHSAIDREIAVEWRSDLPENVHGRATVNKVLLNRRLLDGWIASRGRPGHPAVRMALAALIHELAHFYDRSPEGRLSRDPRLLDLAGWQVKPVRLGLRNRNNAFTDRVAAPYELTDPEEFVAINLEYFLLDATYACRRPALFRYFADRVGHQPPSADCSPGLPFLQPGSNESPLLQLDAERVYGIDYLLAEGNDQPLSRWGHGMYRIVVCAPGRPRGPDCRLDLQYHRVLSFRAFVDDVQVSSWRGLTGSYPSRLFVLPLDQVIDEYTKVELRGLQSIPLNLTPAEIAAVLERAAQIHWSYDGRYYFLSNNCAVEAYKLLHDALPRLAALPLASITPTGLLRRLTRSGLANTTVLEDHDQARRLGYRFDSLDAHFQGMLDQARRSLPLPAKTIKEWFGLSPDQRRPWLLRGEMRATAAMLVLENAALRRQERLSRNELKRRVYGRHALRAPEAKVQTAVNQWLALQGQLSQPAALVKASYGLPQQEERLALVAVSAELATRSQDQGGSIEQLGRALLSAKRRAELEGTEANIAELGKRLRALRETIVSRGGVT